MRKAAMKSLVRTVSVVALLAFAPMGAPAQDAKPVPVNVHNFIRAETDLYFRKAAVDDGAFGKLRHRREMASIDKQDVVRMNRDTLYSSGVFDLEAGAVTIKLPDAGKRFMSMQVISQDHYTTEVVYGPGTFAYDKNKVGTRYVYVIIRTLANPEDPQDVKAANAVQDAIEVHQTRVGKFEVPNWDQASQTKARSALETLGSLGGTVDRFGRKDEVDPIDHLIGTAIGWGGNPRYAADYQSFYPPKNDGKTLYRLSLKDVPVDGFWSISVYNGQGFFEKNELGAYSLNNLTAKPDASGSYVIQFGGCGKQASNCLPIVKGWNFTMRLYRPHKQILDGSWKLPEAQPAS
jgi:para-nitrobenzyl esterase